MVLTPRSGLPAARCFDGVLDAPLQGAAAVEGELAAAFHLTTFVLEFGVLALVLHLVAAADPEVPLLSACARTR